MRCFRCFSSFDLGSECHKCSYARSPNKVVDPVPIQSAKAFVSERGMPLTAVIVNQTFEPPTMILSAPVPEDSDIGDSDLEKLGFKRDSVRNRRLCFVVPCDEELGEFLRDFDIPIDFSPVQRRLERMEKDVAEVRNSLYAVGEHQTQRAIRILKETGKHEQHQDK